jgi:hypothetical protein
MRSASVQLLVRSAADQVLMRSDSAAGQIIGEVSIRSIIGVQQQIRLLRSAAGKVISEVGIRSIIGKQSSRSGYNRSIVDMFSSRLDY